VPTSSTLQRPHLASPITRRPRSSSARPRSFTRGTSAGGPGTRTGAETATPPPKRRIGGTAKGSPLGRRLDRVQVLVASRELAKPAQVHEHFLRRHATEAPFRRPLAGAAASRGRPGPPSRRPNGLSLGRLEFALTPPVDNVSRHAAPLA
jgi:hypothetical protein